MSCELAVQAREHQSDECWTYADAGAGSAYDNETHIHTKYNENDDDDQYKRHIVFFPMCCITMRGR